MLATNIAWDETTKNGTVDASELGWEPGTWPKAFVATLPDGRGFKFETQRVIPGEGCVVYYSWAAERIIKVFND